MATRDLCIAKGAELDLWTDVNAVFDQIAKSWGCELEVSYFDVQKDSSENLALSCNKENVAGVILFGTELYPSDVPRFCGIKKPVVVYDSDLESDRYPCVVVNNAGGVKTAVDYLVEHGKKNIVYLARNATIYNYTKRREGFLLAMQEHNLDTEKKLLFMGEKIDEIYQNMKDYLEQNPLPEAFIAESYHLSIGSIRAFRQKNIKVPKDVSIIGMDELPDYMTGEYQLTTIRIPHTERANWAMQMLYREIYESSSTKSKIYTNCKLMEGNSVL